MAKYIYTERKDFTALFSARGENIFFMNTNEECLLLFLKNPGRIDQTADKLKSHFNSFSNPINIKNLPCSAFDKTELKTKSLA
jgi:hypothetical protein